jgi:hypothetical protein
MVYFIGVPTPAICCAARTNSHSAAGGMGLGFTHHKWELLMAVLDHHDRSTHETNVCAVKFCLTWIGFFVGIGVFTYVLSLL